VCSGNTGHLPHQNNGGLLQLFPIRCSSVICLCTKHHAVTKCIVCLLLNIITTSNQMMQLNIHVWLHSLFCCTKQAAKISGATLCRVSMKRLERVTLLYNKMVITVNVCCNYVFKILILTYNSMCLISTMFDTWLRDFWDTLSTKIVSMDAHNTA
jgi:hypothetical protein